MATFFVSSTTPPLDALYALPPAVPSRPSMLARVTIDPRSPSMGSWSSMRRTACLSTKNVPVRLTSSTSCHAAASSTGTGPPPELAIAADRFGWDAVWTVEHHFLSEFSHCSNPEVLYGAIAARTERIRIGYGVRLMPQPYNHPVRTAESVAVLDLISNGRVDFGTGRSSTRAELEGFGINPHETRQMWQEAIEHVVGCWTNEEYEFEGKYWQLPKRRVQPKPMQQPHPPVWGATSSEDGHRQIGDLGLGLCSFAVGVAPEEVKKKIDIYRA